MRESNAWKDELNSVCAGPGGRGHNTPYPSDQSVYRQWAIYLPVQINVSINVQRSVVTIVSVYVCVCVCIWVWFAKALDLFSLPLSRTLRENERWECDAIAIKWFDQQTVIYCKISTIPLKNNNNKKMLKTLGAIDYWYISINGHPSKVKDGNKMARGYTFRMMDTINSWSSEMEDASKI